MMRYPEGFLFGAATSAYQIEGAALSDGRGPCCWDMTERDSEGNYVSDTGEIACDHYHRYVEDVALMKELNLQSYRFSISWPRIFPKGRGEVNANGIAFYHNLIDELLANHIEPMATTWHGDLPQALLDEGGWANPETIEAYLEYVNLLFTEFGSKVKKWITHNEMHWVSHTGQESMQDSLNMNHHLNLAHSLAVKAYRAHVYGDGMIGITHGVATFYPATDQVKDIEAASREDGRMNRWYLEPSIKGEYPQDLVTLYQQAGCDLNFSEMVVLKENICDFIGINYYSSSTIKQADREDIFNLDYVSSGRDTTDMGWEINPDGLYDALMNIKENYHNVPVYITENGAAFKDDIRQDEYVFDQDRQDYLSTHLERCEKAIADGVNLKGYYAWSLLDNFEWAFGYAKRFGIIRVNYETQERTIKQSGQFYKRYIAAHKA